MMQPRFGTLWCMLVLLLGSRGEAAEKPILVLDADGHTALVRKVYFTRDGKELVSVSWDKTIRVWDVATGESLRVLRPPIGTGSEGMLYAGALDPSRNILAVAGYGFVGGDCRIYLISMTSGQVTNVLVGHHDPVLALAFSPDGGRLISSGFDQTARIWNVSTGKTELVLRGHTKEIYGVAFSPDGRRCATSSHDHTAAIWDVITGQRQAVLKGHTSVIHSVAWRPDGQVLATGSDDRTIRIWGPDGKAYQGFNNVAQHNISCVAFTGDSRRLLFTQAYGTTNNYNAGILDVATGRELARFEEHRTGIAHGALSPDGKLAATADFFGEIFLWRTSDGARVRKLAGGGHVPMAAAWSPDGTKIAWGNQNIGTEVNVAKPLERSFDLSKLEAGPVPNENFYRVRTERGRLTLVMGTPNSVGQPGTLVAREGGLTLATMAMTDPYEWINSFTLLAGDRVAVGTAYRLLLYEARTGQPVHEFQGHTGGIWSLSTSPDNRYLLSASDDMTLRVWKPDASEPLISCFFTDNDWIVWTRAGYYAASPGGEKLMGWHVNNGRDQMSSYFPASQFRASLYRPDVIKLLLKTGSVERALEEADRALGQKTFKTEVAAVLPPKVKITSPGTGHESTQNRLEIRATATSTEKNAITAMRLLLDDRPYQGLKGVQTLAEPKLGFVETTWQVELEPGKHKLKVLADTAVSQGSSEGIEVVYLGGESETVKLPKLYVVAIGITEYPGALKLNYAAKDAESLGNALKSHSKSLFREIEIQTITNAKATRAGVLKGLTWLRGQMTQNDYGIFFFAGHGDLDNDGALYFLPVDADARDLVTSAIPADQVKRVLSGIPGKLITIFDACHSAGIAGSETGKRRAGQASLTDDLVRDLVTDENGVIAMCSSTGREFSLENNQFRQGSFTLAIVEGLSGKADFNKDGVVYLNELDTYVTDRVKELTKGQQHPVTAKPGSIRSFPLAKP